MGGPRGQSGETGPMGISGKVGPPGRRCARPSSDAGEGRAMLALTQWTCCRVMWGPLAGRSRVQRVGDSSRGAAPIGRARAGPRGGRRAGAVCADGGRVCGRRPRLSRAARAPVAEAYRSRHGNGPGYAG